MAADKVKVSVDLDFPDEASSSGFVKGLIRVEVLEQTSGGFINKPVVVVFDVEQQAAGAKLLDVEKMEDDISAVFCRAEKKNTGNIVFISGGVKVKDGATGLRYVPLNLKDAIEKVKRCASSSVVGEPAGFIIVVSDGGSTVPRGNERDSLCQDLMKYKVPVHAIGLGSTHDSELLQDIVTSSKGTYYYIPVTKDKEKLNSGNYRVELNRAVMQDVAKCLGWLTTVVAVDTCVKISLPMTYNKELTIAKIQSGADDIIPTKTCRREGKIPIDCLYAGEVKQFVVHLAFKPKTRLCELTAVVVESHSHNEKKLAKEYKEKFRVNSSSWKRGRSPNPELPEQMIRSRVAQMLLKFAKDFKGDSSKKRLTEEGGKDLQQRWENLKEEEGGNLRMVADLHKRYNSGRVDLAEGIGMDIAAMAESLEAGSGLGCIYSWASSYQMQRPTTTGPTAAQPALDVDDDAKSLWW